MKFDRYEILTRHYKKQIRDWNWESIKKDIKESCLINENDEIEGTSYLGSVLNIYPSGKLYTPWTTNQKRSDVIKDECFNDALEAVASEHGLFITGSDSDGCDVCAGMILDYEDVIYFQTDKDEERAKELFGETEETNEDEIIELINVVE